MPKLRVFISSTMKDLVNERLAVKKRLAEFNMEPLNAEAWLPDGSRSWERIEKEISSSDVFVLISGERYGWIPDKGPHGGAGKSVTHLEFDAAERLVQPARSSPGVWVSCSVLDPPGSIAKMIQAAE